MMSPSSSAKPQSVSAVGLVDALKIPPHSIEAEQAVLGGLMLDNSAWDQVSELVGEEDFYLHEHRVIFHALLSLFQSHTPFDVLTVSDYLKQRDELTQARGEPYLFELARTTPGAANIIAYANIVRERSVLRQLVSAASRIAESAFHPEGRSVNELLDQAEQSVFKIAEQGMRAEGPVDINHVMSKTMDRIHLLAEAKGEVTGLSTGFTDLDKMTTGLQPADLVIVAGRPSMGKTMFGLNIAEYAALNLAKQQDKKAILVFSMEMPAESLVMRMFSSIGRVEQQRIRTGRLHDEDWPRISSAVAMFSQSKLFIDDTPALSPSELRARARRVAREQGGIGLILVDYLQLMRVPGYHDNRVQEVSEISRSLKALAKELHVPVVALSQLNRSLEQRQDKRPVMSDIRESGSIEQDADLILFLYRDEVYNENSDQKNTAEIIIGKQRNGPIGTLKLKFSGSLSRFDNLDLYHVSSPSY